MRTIWIALAAFSLTGGQALAQDAPPLPVAWSRVLPDGDYLVRPTWVQAPTPQELAALYPDAARQAQVRGRVEVACQFTPDGWLTNCLVTSETPPEYGFAQATIRALRSFQAVPTAENGRAVSGLHILLGVNWPPSRGSDGPSYETIGAGIAPSPAEAPPSRAVAPHPSWERLPTGDQLAALYPRRAWANGVEGEAVIRSYRTATSRTVRSPRKPRRVGVSARRLWLRRAISK
jgi:TonB family protein